MILIILVAFGTVSKCLKEIKGNEYQRTNRSYSENCTFYHQIEILRRVLKRITVTHISGKKSPVKTGVKKFALEKKYNEISKVGDFSQG